MGRPRTEAHPVQGPVSRRLSNIRAIWNNEHDNDHGIEKVLRLFLASSQFLFPGLYWKELFSRRLYTYQDIAVDLYVIAKILIPAVILVNGWGPKPGVVWVTAYLIAETMLYTPTIIFASDVIGRPRSYRRSMLLVFLNYLEIILGFAVIYSSGNMLNQPFHHWFDPIYYSFMTASTIGYGDYYPITPLAKFLVSVQSILFILFLYIFLNFFTSRVKGKGYFEDQ